LIRSYYDEATRAFPQIKVTQLKELPIPKLTLSADADKGRHQQMVRMVESMLALYGQLAAARSATQKAILQRQIDATDAEIDRLVYDLYDLAPAEIAVIESPASQSRAPSTEASG
jgi:hypothetical protein